MKNRIILAFATATLLCSCVGNNQDNKKTEAFPFEIPTEKPNIKLSSSMEALYDRYQAITPQHNELYTVFRFSPITGFDNDNQSGRFSRRDPSRIVKVGDTYYMWYTLRKTKEAPTGAKNYVEELPTVDWDMSDIGYAISKDGFTWEEKGVAVARPPKPQQGHRSISTPEILVWEGKYYLYFQAFNNASGTAGGDNCPVAMAEASSPDGPWKYYDKVVIPTGEEGTWDGYNIHDPLPVVFKGKIYMYYKSDWNYSLDGSKELDHMRSQGVCIGDSPFGPFVKCDVNPILSSGHETQLFRFKDGIAAICTRDGHEHYTVQYSEDGINFNQASVCAMMPEASGIYDPDAFTNVDYAKGITWGICHINVYRTGGTYSHMFRFDCDLSLDLDDPEMKINHVRPTYEDYMKRGLTAKQINRIKNSK